MNLSQYQYIHNYNIYPEYINYITNDLNIHTIPNKNHIYDPDSHFYYTQLFLTKQLPPNLSYNPFKHAWKDFSTFDNYEYDTSTPIINDDTNYTNDSIEDEFHDSDNESIYESSEEEFNDDDDLWTTI